MGENAMNYDKNANGKNTPSDNKPYVMVGSGRLTAGVWKIADERSGWRYRFNIYRTIRASGRVSQWFGPSDIEHFAKLVEVLAITLADDGCLKDSLRDDLLCLASCLDDVLGCGATRLQPSALTAVVINSIEAVVQHFRDDEAKDYAANPSTDHIFLHLRVLDRWLRPPRAATNRIVNLTQ
jgi:hypothetical protein